MKIDSKGKKERRSSFTIVELKGKSAIYVGELLYQTTLKGKGEDPFVGWYEMTFTPDKVKVKTKKGHYVVPKHPKMNAYMGLLGKVKCRITIKKHQGTLCYWW